MYLVFIVPLNELYSEMLHLFNMSNVFWREAENAHSNSNANANQQQTKQQRTQHNKNAMGSFKTEYIAQIQKIL